MAITIEHSYTKELLKRHPHLDNSTGYCFFCKVETNYRYPTLDKSCCPYCATHHSVEEFHTDLIAEIIQQENIIDNRDTVIVDKIWQMLGNPAYSELKGRSIYDLIQELIDAKNELEKLRAESINDY